MTIKFELQCSPAIATAITNSPDLPIEIYERTKVQRDVGSFMESFAAGIAANYGTRFIDYIAKLVISRDPDQHSDDDHAVHESCDHDNDTGQQAVYFIFAGDTFDLTIPLDRQDCLEALQSASEDKPDSET